MVSRQLVYIALACLTFATPAYSQAGGGKASDVHHQAMGFERLQGKYALTAEQEQQLQSLSSELVAQLQAKAPAIRAKKLEIIKALTEAKIDSGNIQALQNDMNTASNDFANAILQNQIKQMQILTPEQRAQMRPTDNEMSTESGK
jgi:Spy/CpxP family protein refolding chaperone